MTVATREPLPSWLDPGGTNVFQEIKALEAKKKAQGQEVIRLSVGEPEGPALLSARRKASKLVLSGDEDIHSYQDNGSRWMPDRDPKGNPIPDFAQRFCQVHVKTDLGKFDHLAFLPTPGIKPMLGLVPLACGSADANRTLMIATTTNPGYGVSSTWAGYIGEESYALETTPENDFLFSDEDIKSGTNLLMTNYPHNPSGAISPEMWLMQKCAFCEAHGIRFFNDAAYNLVDHFGRSVSLADIAVMFPGLSWAENYSASKSVGNATGWRVGAMVGSRDFIGDIARIKSNTDSGLVAFAAGGALHALENDKAGIAKVQSAYKDRTLALTDMLTTLGMSPTVRADAGFFTLWNAPKRAFGQKTPSGKEFNNLMIQKAGISGVPFGKYIRYAVVSDILVGETLEKISRAFVNAEVSY